MTPPNVLEGIRLPSEAECVCAAAVEVASAALRVAWPWSGGGTGVGTSLTAGLGWSLGLSVAKRRPHHTELLGWPARPKSLKTRTTPCNITPPLHAPATYTHTRTHKHPPITHTHMTRHQDTRTQATPHCTHLPRAPSRTYTYARVKGTIIRWPTVERKTLREDPEWTIVTKKKIVIVITRDW